MFLRLFHKIIFLVQIITTKVRKTICGHDMTYLNVKKDFGTFTYAWVNLDLRTNSCMQRTLRRRHTQLSAKIRYFDHVTKNPKYSARQNPDK